MSNLKSSEKFLLLATIVGSLVVVGKTNVIVNIQSDDAVVEVKRSDDVMVNVNASFLAAYAMMVHEPRVGDVSVSF